MTKLTPSSWVKIALIVLLCLVLCAGLAGCFAVVQRGVNAAVGNFAHHYGAIAAGSDYDNYGSAEVPADSVRSISIDWLAGEVEVFALDDEACNGMIQVQESHLDARTLRDSDRMAWNLDEDGVLSIAYAPGNAFFTPPGLFGCSHATKRLSVAIPLSRAHEFENLQVAGASGKYSLTNVGARSLNVELASGELVGLGLSADALRLSMASGEASMEGRFTEQAGLDIASGNVALNCIDACPRTASIDMMSGTVQLYTPAESGYSATFDCLSGSYSCPRAQLQGDVYVVGDGSSRFTVDMASGNVTID